MDIELVILIALSCVFFILLVFFAVLIAWRSGLLCFKHRKVAKPVAASSSAALSPSTPDPPRQRLGTDPGQLKHLAKAKSTASLDIATAVTRISLKSGISQSMEKLAYMGTIASHSTTRQSNEITQTGTETWAPSNVELSLPAFIEVKKTDYNIEKLLYKGKNASIYLAKGNKPRLRQFGDTIIVKIAHKTEETMSEEEFDAFHQEVSIQWYYQKNDRFAKILGYSYKPLAIIMKSYNLGSLEHWVFSSTIQKTKSNVFYLIMGVSLAIADMHRVGFVHNDIKPSNILIERQGPSGLYTAVLTDFGITQVVDNTAMLVKDFRTIISRGLSISFAAPEYMLRVRSVESSENVDGNEAKAADIYSYAVVLFETLTRTFSWS